MRSVAGAVAGSLIWLLMSTYSGCALWDVFPAPMNRYKWIPRSLFLNHQTGCYLPNSPRFPKLLFRPMSAAAPVVMPFPSVNFWIASSLVLLPAMH